MGKPGAQALDKNPNWQGGRTIASTGYVLIKRPHSPMSDSRGYVYEHRHVMAQVLGRSLERHEIVHHVDGDKTNNSPENLRLCASVGHHYLNHRTNKTLRKPGEPNPLIVCACGCGTLFKKYDTSGRPRSFISGHNKRSRNGRFKD